MPLPVPTVTEVVELAVVTGLVRLAPMPGGWPLTENVQLAAGQK